MNTSPSRFVPLFPKIQQVGRVVLSVIIAGICTFCLLRLLQTNAWAQSEANVSPESAGRISGRVTNEAGEPLKEIHVVLYTSQQQSLVDQSWTDAAGLYAFPLLGAGIYKLYFFDAYQQYAEEYYTDAGTFFDAKELVVAGNSLTGIDVVLEKPGTIQGTISTIDQEPLQSLSVELYLRVDKGWSHLTSQSWGTDPLRTSLPYSFTAQPNHNYSVCVSAQTKKWGRIGECYDNVAPFDPNVKTITVTSGSTVNGIDLVLGDGANLATIQGRVTAETGEPIADATVSSYHLDDWWGLTLVKENSVKTDANGVYTLSYLSTIEYSILFEDGHGEYVAEYYPEKLNLRPFESRKGVDASLALAGKISGTVLVDNQPGKGWIFIYQKQQETWLLYQNAGIGTQTDGTYRLLGLPAGVYRICVSYYNFSGCYPNRKEMNDALDVVVKAGETTSDINIQIEFHQYDGEISGQVIGDGMPASGIRVELYDRFYFYPDSVATPLVYTVTNPLGQYKLEGLAAGSYYVRFMDPTQLYATTFYTGLLFPEEIKTVNVTVNQPITNIDISLNRAGSIQGNVIDYDGKPIKNASIHLYRYNRNNWQSVYLYDTRTDAQGTYLASGLLPGIYRVGRFTAFGYETRFYGNTSDVRYAKDVVVTAGATTNNIDIAYNQPLNSDESEEPMLPNRLFLPLLAR